MQMAEVSEAAPASPGAQIVLPTDRVQSLDEYLKAAAPRDAASSSNGRHGAAEDAKPDAPQFLRRTASDGTRHAPFLNHADSRNVDHAASSLRPSHLVSIGSGESFESVDTPTLLHVERPHAPWAPSGDLTSRRDTSKSDGGGLSTDINTASEVANLRESLLRVQQENKELMAQLEISKPLLGKRGSMAHTISQKKMHTHTGAGRSALGGEGSEAALVGLRAGLIASSGTGIRHSDSFRSTSSILSYHADSHPFGANRLEPNPSKLWQSMPAESMLNDMGQSPETEPLNGSQACSSFALAARVIVEENRKRQLQLSQSGASTLTSAWDESERLPPKDQPQGFLRRGWNALRNEFSRDNRDCWFEIASICAPCCHYSGSWSRTEADDRRTALQGLSPLRKTWTVSFNLLFGILHPQSILRQCWDLIMLVALMYIAFMVPIYLCFTITPSQVAPALQPIDRAVDVLFILDLYINTRSAYVNPINNQLVTRRKKILRHYATTWMPLDFISSIPFDWFMTAASASSVRLVKTSKLAKLLKIFRVFKVFKLLKLMKLPSTFNSLDGLLDKSVMRLTVFFTSGALVAHFMACIFYWVATIGNDPLDPYPGWTAILEEEEMNTVEKYVASLYWSFSTITTVGYGDLTPTNTYERLFAIIAMVVGVTVFAYFMGSMTSVVSAMNESQQQYDKRMEEMEAFLGFRDIPAGLAERVKSYYRFLWARELQQEETRWLDNLNSALRTEMVLYMYHDAVSRVPFFHGKHPHFIASLVTKLKPEMYSPHDVVSREGEPATCMYFVSRGCLDVCLKIQDDVAQDILHGRSLPAGFTSYSATRSPAGEDGANDYQKLVSNLQRNVNEAGEFDPEQSGESIRSQAGPGKSAMPTGQDNGQQASVARRRVMASLQGVSLRRQATSVLQGGVRRRGVTHDAAEDAEVPAKSASTKGEVIYVIPDDQCKFSGEQSNGPSRSEQSRWKRRVSNSSKEDVLPEKDFHTMFAMSRRATQVHSDLEMIEAVQLMGNGAHAYRRMRALQPGAYFGEYSCLLGLQRSITVVAVEFVEVFALMRQDLEANLQDWPDVETEFRSLVTTFNPAGMDKSNSVDAAHIGSKLRPSQESEERQARTPAFSSITSVYADSPFEQYNGGVRTSAAAAALRPPQDQEMQMTPPPQPLTSAASEQYSERTLSAARVAALKLRRASYTNFDPRNLDMTMEGVERSTASNRIP